MSFQPASIRPMRDRDLDATDRIMRTAFGTFFGVPDPSTTFGDAQMVRTRFASESVAGFVAELDGEIAGSNFATQWGSYGFFGPLTVRVDLWDRGIAGQLVQAAIDQFDRWHVRQAGLFTFPQSARHVGLYQKFGFWPQHLTAVMAKPVAAGLADVAEIDTCSNATDERAVIDECREITEAIFADLDLSAEIRSTGAQAIGETVILHDGSTLTGFAICHLGAGETAGGTCFVKFAAVRPSPDAGEQFERLIVACEALARRRGLSKIVAGVNVARHDAYRRLLAHGFRTFLQGVIMQRPNDAGYCRPEAYIIDDLR